MKHCSILFWGVIWGAFEATAGFLLHLLPFSIGAYVWFPAAYFFLDRAYRKTGRRSAVVYTGMLAAGLKLLNLFSQVRTDYVINPAASIVLEALAMAFALSLAWRPRRAIAAICFEVFAVNTLWRLLYIAYIGTLAPAAFREVSVAASAPAVFTFMVQENIVSSFVCVAIIALARGAGAGNHFNPHISRP